MKAGYITIIGYIGGQFVQQVAYTRDGLVIDLTARKPWGICGNGFFGPEAYLGQHSAGSMRRSIAILYWHHH
jgi:hypothetical protein